MAARSCGCGTNFDWLRKSCDISTCDLSPEGNPEKYRRPMKSAISMVQFIFFRVERLFLTVPWGCLQFVIVVFPDHTHLLF